MMDWSQLYWIWVPVWFIGTSVIARSCYLWGQTEGFNRGYEGNGLNVEGFDDKVDIVCNACGLVAEITCASCNPVKCDLCGDVDCDWGVTRAAVIKGKTCDGGAKVAAFWEEEETECMCGDCPK